MFLVRTNSDIIQRQSRYIYKQTFSLFFQWFYQSSDRKMNLYYEYVRGLALYFHRNSNFIEFPFSGGDQLRCSYEFFRVRIQSVQKERTGSWKGPRLTSYCKYEVFWYHQHFLRHQAELCRKIKHQALGKQAAESSREAFERVQGDGSRSPFSFSFPPFSSPRKVD